VVPKILKMKPVIHILLLTLFLCSCKKKESSTQEETTPPPANGTISMNIASIDSVGDTEAKTYSTSVFLSSTPYSGVADTFGKISFNVPPGTYFPSIIRPKYESVPLSINVTSNNTSSVNTIVARNSPYVLSISSGAAVNQDSVTLNLSLNKPIPAGKTIKLAVLFGSTNTVSVNSYSVVSELYMYQQSYSNFNVCSGAVKTAINQLSGPSPFYLVVVPVTYGNFYSSILNKNILVGDNLPSQGVPTASIQLTKTW
jgi:hypothetical protein